MNDFARRSSTLSKALIFEANYFMFKIKLKQYYEIM